MSERITIVVPDGTRDKLSKEAKAQGRSQSNLSRKYILDGLSGNDGRLTATIRGEDLKLSLTRLDRGSQTV